MEKVPEYSLPDLVEQGQSWVFAITRNHNKVVEEEVEEAQGTGGTQADGNEGSNLKSFFTESHLFIENVRIPKEKLVGRSRPGWFSHILDDLYKMNTLPPTARRSRIGVLYVPKKQGFADMHIVINGEDMGACAKGIPTSLPLYAVVDVFAATKSVRIVQVEYGLVIENPLVATKDPEKEDRFCPSTPSLYRLLVTEAHTTIRMCTDLDTESRLLSLFHIPVKDSGDFYSLGDITANGQSLDGSFINILAAVRLIGEPKYFTTSDGRKGQKLEIKLFDETLMSFPFICWDRETIQFVQTLPPRETVLFIVDARISFDTFRNCMVATATSKTIITINPDTLEANQLFTYAKDLSESEQLEEPEIEVNINVPLDSISDVLTVSQIKDRAKKSSNAFYGVLYGFITTLGLDSCITKVIRSRCDRCKYIVNEEMEVCTNAACPKQGQVGEVSAAFDLLVDVADHTGTLQGFNLSGTVAEQTLGCTHIRMYDLNSNNPNPVINYDGVSKNITSVGFHEDGRWMYTGGEDCMARIWDLRSRNLQCQRIFQVNAPINCVCLHPNQAELFVGDQSGVIHIWDLKTDHNEQLIPEPEVSVNSVHIDPDASYMAAVNSSGNCYVWNLAGGIGDEVTQLIPKTKIPAHKRYSLRCKFSPDSTLLATCSADQTCKIWRTSNFSLMTELSIKSNNPGETSRGWMWDCAFSGDSQYIVT
ncbi:target of rapamycin complex subunit lst8, partial [Clarias magur]